MAQRLEADRLRLEDKVCRSHAILTHARLISAEEAMELLSDERLGISLGILDGEVDTVNALISEIQPATLCLNAVVSAGAQERDEMRAALLKKRLA